MNWQNIKVSKDGTYFQYDGKPIFGKQFIEVLKFHKPGFAPVKDESGSFHIDTAGTELYSERYSRTFGFYCNRAAVIDGHNWFHITEKGERAYSQSYNWTGNFQENLCTVRDHLNQYFHIDLNGNRVYDKNYTYCGDFKDGFACVKQLNDLYKHIDSRGTFLNDKEYVDLGIFHKNLATAKDKEGWYHIDKTGSEIYKQRYLAIEPFYNGFALVTRFNGAKTIIAESGEMVLEL